MPQCQLKEYSEIHDKSFFSPTNTSSNSSSDYRSLQTYKTSQRMRSEITMELDQGTNVFKGAAGEGGGQLTSTALR